MSHVPIKLPSSKVLFLSPGKHNLALATIVEEFVSRFAKGSVLLYLDDTEKKHLHIDTKKLKSIGFR